MSLYTLDLYAWCHTQRALLAAGDLAALDTGHLLEALDDMAQSTLSELANRLHVLLAHLLKLQMALEHRPLDYERARRVWWLTCQEQRRRLATHLTRYRSLRAMVPTVLADEYPAARIVAARDLPLDEAAIPETCPWNVDEVLETLTFD